MKISFNVEFQYRFHHSSVFAKLEHDRSKSESKLENIVETEIPAVSRPVGLIWPDGQTFQTPQTTLKNHPEHSKTRFLNAYFLKTILKTYEKSFLDPRRNLRNLYLYIQRNGFSDRTSHLFNIYKKHKINKINISIQYFITALFRVTSRYFWTVKR